MLVSKNKGREREAHLGQAPCSAFVVQILDKFLRTLEKLFRKTKEREEKSIKKKNLLHKRNSKDSDAALCKKWTLFFSSFRDKPLESICEDEIILSPLSTRSC